MQWRFSVSRLIDLYPTAFADVWPFSFVKKAARACFPTAIHGTESGNGSRRTLALFFIIALGAVLRLEAMNGRVLLGDEVGTARGVHETYWYLMTHFGNRLTQPAYLILSRFFANTLWVGEFPIRLPSLLFGISGIVAVYFLGTTLFSRRVGLLSALLLALNPYHIFYSQMARGYVMAATLSTLSFLWLLKLIETRKPLHAACYVLSTSLAIYCHLGCVGIVLGELIVVSFIACARRSGSVRRILLPVAASVALVGVLSFLLYLPAMNDIVEFRQHWTGKQGGGFSLGFVPLMLTAYMGGRGWSIYVFSLFAVLGLVEAIKRGFKSAAPLVAWPLGVFLFYWANDSGHYPWAFSRFFFIALPGLVITAAAGIVAVFEAAARRCGTTDRRPTVLLWALVGVFLLTTSSKVIEVSFGKKDTRWPAVISFIESAFPPDALVVSLPMGFNSFAFYAHRASLNFYDVTIRESLVEALETRANMVWARSPVVYVVDIISLGDVEGLDAFTIKRFGAASIVYLSERRETTARERLEALETMTKAVIRYLERNLDDEITADWMYWRIAPEQQHLYVGHDLLAVYYSLLAMVEKSLGKTQEAETSRMTAQRFSRMVKAPGQVHSSWTMLCPHADFLRKPLL